VQSIEAAISVIEVQGARYNAQQAKTITR